MSQLLLKFSLKNVNNYVEYLSYLVHLLDDISTKFKQNLSKIADEQA